MTFPIARLALLILFLLLGAPPARAQEPVEFDPVRDLEQFEQHSFSEYSELYDVGGFEARKGEVVSPEELAALRASWKEKVERATARIAAIRSDPREKTWYALRKELARTTFFSARELVEFRTRGRLMLLVELPAGVDAGWPGKIAADYVPWLTQVAEVFDARYVKPLGLARRAGAQADVVCVLADEASYREYTRQSGLPATELAPATWDARLGMVVAYEDAFTAAIAPVWQRYPMLREYVRALESAHHAGTGARPGSLWLEEGLASYLAWHAGDAPATLEQRAIAPDTLAALVWTMQDARARELFLHSLPDLVGFRGTRAVIETAESRAQEGGLPNPAWQDALRVFYAESTLWMHFLQESQGGRYRPAFDKYLRAALSGPAGYDVFSTHVVIADATAFEREFHEYVLDEHARAFPDARVDRGVVDAILALRSVAAPAEEAAESAAGSTPGSEPGSEPGGRAPAKRAVLVPSKSFSPAELAPDPRDVLAQHAVAIALASKGDLAAAIRRLEELDARRPVGEPGARIARDLGRVRDLEKLRDGYFESLRQKKEKWITKWKGRQMITGIAKSEGGYLHFVDNKLGLGKVPLAEIEPYEVARQAGRPEEQGGAGPATRAYAYLLGGDAKWDKLLKDDEGSRALKADGQTWYPELLKSGQAALALEGLSQTALPKNEREARAVTTRVKALLEAGLGLPIVERKLEGLRQLALHALARTYVEKPPKELAHGVWTPLGGERVSLVYDFEEADQALDFVRENGVLDDWRRKLPALEKPAANSYWEVEDGAFSGSGAACYRHFLGFAAPLTVRWQVRHDTSEVEEPATTTSLVSICDDLAGSTIACVNFGDLVVNDRATRLQRSFYAKEPFAHAYEQVYALEIRHDGTTISTWVDGEMKYEAPAGPRRSGKVLLWFHCDDRISIEKLEIEGALDPAAVAALKEEEFAKRLSELGFP